VLSEPAITKLRFVHDVIAAPSDARQAESASCTVA